MASRSGHTWASILCQLRAQPLRASAWRAPLAPFRTRQQAPFIINSIAVRAAHSIPRPPRPQPVQPKDSEVSQVGEAPKSEGERPPPKIDSYQLSFTCVPCGHRSHHNVSKQGYHHGSTLITCPSCRNRHVISDHLNIFGDRKITIEDIMREKGQLVKRGSLGEDGDIEFWPEESHNDLIKSSGSGKSS